MTLRKQLSIVIPSDKKEVYDVLCDKCADRSVSDFIVTLIDGYINSSSVVEAYDSYVYGDGDEDDDPFLKSLNEAQALVMAQGMAIQQAKSGIQSSMDDINDMMNADADGFSSSTEPEPTETGTSFEEAGVPSSSENPKGTSSSPSSSTSASASDPEYVTKDDLMNILDDKINQLLAVVGNNMAMPSKGVTSDTAPNENLFEDDVLDEGTAEDNTQPAEDNTKAEEPLEEDASDSVAGLLGSLI